MRNRVLNGWRQIDVPLKRRHDLVPNLVNAVRGSMELERNAHLGHRGAREGLNSHGTERCGHQKEGQLSLALGRLFALAENYPTLKSNENVKMLQEELSATETRRGFARQFYNDISTKLNTARQVFSTNLLAGMFGFSRRSCSRNRQGDRARGAHRRFATQVEREGREGQKPLE